MIRDFSGTLNHNSVTDSNYAELIDSGNIQDTTANNNSVIQDSKSPQGKNHSMQESLVSNVNAAAIIDFSVNATGHRASVTSQQIDMRPTSLDLDFHSTAAILKSAEATFERRDFKTTARLLEQALPALDRLYTNDEAGKLRALRILRDSYLALSKGVEAKDCAEVGLSVFEEIMRNNKITPQTSLLIGDPSAFAKPVVRKLKTLRRSKDSEFLKKRSVDVADKWRTFIKLIW